MKAGGMAKKGLKILVKRKRIMQNKSIRPMLDTYYERSCIAGTVGFRSKNMEIMFGFFAVFPFFVYLCRALSIKTTE